MTTKKQEAKMEEAKATSQVDVNNQTLNLTLTVQDANTILAGLDELPHKYSARIVALIQEQAASQLS